MWSNVSGRASIAAIGLFAAAWLAAPASAQTQTPDEARFHLKPGAAGKVCLECHVDFKDVLARASVHTPVKAGRCASCHSPHAADHGKLLAASPQEICASCHGSMIPEGALSAHRPVSEGQCVACHDPHGSANKANLVRSGNELCLGCHTTLKASLGSATHRHPPVDRSCLGCHDPHASKNSRRLLAKSPPSLCLGCHKPDQPLFTKAHMNYPVAAADCTSCHDPHGSGNRAILWATVHPPVLNRMCSQCHAEPAGGKMTLKRFGADLCRGCHNNLLVDIGSKNREHWPLLDKAACANCHEPHASRTANLLLAPQKELCGSCHPDSIARQDRSVTKHPPVNEGECTTCHQPHASDATFLFASSDEKEVCGTCHDWSAHAAHPIGESAVDQRNPNLRVSCKSCHRSHGTAFEHFAHADVKGELCMQCHTQITR